MFDYHAVIAAIFAISASGYSEVLYVNECASGKNDGSSWSDAYISLSDALNSASAGDEIWVAQGS